MARTYRTVDVFTRRRFGGNPLAVVLEAEGLGTDEMQAIAAEFNYSETVFLLPPEDPVHTARLRIFTPRAEVPFAGHPNVGAAFVVAQLGSVFGRTVEEKVVFEELAGQVPIRIERGSGEVTGAELSSPKPWEGGSGLPVELAAECLGLSPGDFSTELHPPVRCGAGLEFLVAEMTDLEALARARPRAAAFAAHLPADKAAGVLVYTRSDDEDADFRSRVFAPELGVPEDPATGSATVAFAGLRADLDPLREGSLRYRLRQGVEIGRPSDLLAGAAKRGGRVTDTSVGGPCVPVMEGRLV